MPYRTSGQAGASLPSGVIVLWSGTITTIPAGWALCNGANGTPDLRNRFIVCANADHEGAAKSTVEQNTARQTGGNVDHTHTFTFSGGGTANIMAGTGIGSGTAYSPAASVSVSGGGNTEQQRIGATTGFDLVPPFYALAYIMKL